MLVVVVLVEVDVVGVVGLEILGGFVGLNMPGTGGKNEVLFAVVVEDGGVEEGISGLTSAKTMVDP